MNVTPASGGARPGNLLLALAVGLLGGVIGHFAFLWIARQGFYALMIPGALVGAGAGLLTRDKSVARAVICGVLGLAFGLFSEWRFAPFIADGSLGYFLGHLHQLRPLTLIMIAGGGALAYWFSMGRVR